MGHGTSKPETYRQSKSILQREEIELRAKLEEIDMQLSRIALAFRLGSVKQSKQEGMNLLEGALETKKKEFLKELADVTAKILDKDMKLSIFQVNKAEEMCNESPGQKQAIVKSVGMDMEKFKSAADAILGKGSPPKQASRMKQDESEDIFDDEVEEEEEDEQEEEEKEKEEHKTRHSKKTEKLHKQPVVLTS